MTTPSGSAVHSFLPRGRQAFGDVREAMTAECANRYRGGQSIAFIATEIERSYGFVHRLLIEGGVTLRRPGGQPGRKRFRS